MKINYEDWLRKQIRERDKEQVAREIREFESKTNRSEEDDRILKIAREEYEKLNQ